MTRMEKRMSGSISDGQSMWQNFYPNLNNSVEKCFEDPAISNFNER